ncbi:unnamed protein product [Pleuronectes platessa]|uniref:Uncharacterized protein n=1 Tax=Pleuronectes platessa TaxID=8262 RepID=A0A9N7YFN6_PLEPL|nr:unnamed protein product [Pleuronectes platessa]
MSEQRAEHKGPGFKLETHTLRECRPLSNFLFAEESVGWRSARCNRPLTSRFGGRLPEPGDNEARDETTVRRDWRNLRQTVGRLVSSEPGSHANYTGGRLFQAVVGKEERKNKTHPRLTLQKKNLRLQKHADSTMWPGSHQKRQEAGEQCVSQGAGEWDETTCQQRR